MNEKLSNLIQNRINNATEFDILIAVTRNLTTNFKDVGFRFSVKDKGAFMVEYLQEQEND